MDLTVTFPGNLQVDAQIGPLTIHTDQPKLAGGDGSGPAPYSLFLASLGTCAGIYVLGFCKNRGLPTEGIKLIQHHDFNPISGKLESVKLDIQVPESFPRKYHQALVRVADQCAVKKTLLNPPDISVNTVVAGEMRAAG